MVCTPSVEPDDLLILGSGPLLSPLLSELRESAFPAPVLEADPWLASLGGRRLAILLDPGFEVAKVLELALGCSAVGLPLLPAILGDLGVQIGPWALPAGGPCPRCVLMRLDAARQAVSTVGATLGEVVDRGGKARECPSCTCRPSTSPSGPPASPVSPVSPGPPAPPGSELLALAARTIVGLVSQRLEEQTGPGSTRMSTGASAVGSLLLAHWGDDAFAEHAVLRASECPDCRRRSPYPAFRFPDPPTLDDGPPLLDEAGTLRLFDTLVDPLTGPIVRFQERRPRSEGPRFFQYRAAWAGLGGPRGSGDVAWGSGTALAAGEARAAALCEAVERASVLPWPSSTDLLHASARELGPRALDDRRFDVFHPHTRAARGFPYRRATVHDRLEWLWGWSLSRGEPRLIPAHRVFLGASPHAQGPGLPDAPIVSGFACAASFAEAARRGLLEVLERDAFMLAWAHRLPLARLDGDSLGEARPHLEAFAAETSEDAGFEARCFELRLEHGLPFVLAMFRSQRPGDAAAGVASAANPHRGAAARRALCELAMVYRTLREALARHRGPLPDPRRPETVVEMHQHALLYARPDMLPTLEPWWTSVPVDTGAPEDVDAGLEALVERLAAFDLEVLVVDLTRPEIRELGLRVVKVLVPGTYPMNFDSRWPQFGGRRMVEAPVKAGLLERPTPFEALNRIPHPFP